MAGDRASVTNIEDGRQVRPGISSPDAAVHAVDASLGFSAGSIDSFPGPALMVGRDNWVICANVYADPLITALKEDASGVPGAVLRSLGSMMPVVQKIAVKGQTGQRQFDLTVLPVTLDERSAAAFPAPGSRAAMLFARETTLEHNLTDALVASRQMFKDLVSCTSDFAWETDAQGLFRYVSPRGAFGYGAHELTGKRARDLVVACSQHATPFSTQERIDDVAATLCRSNGARASALISATPVFDQRGEWLGTRGLCRDMTDAVQIETRSHALETRHGLAMHLARLARDVTATRKTGHSATALIADALDARCWILRHEPSGFTAEDSAAGPMPAHLLDHVCNVLAKIADSHRSAAALRPVFESAKDGELLIQPTGHHGIINGALVLLRPAEDGEGTDLGDEELTLFDEAADLVGLILEQQKNLDELELLSRTDKLTGLLNARAFSEAAEGRLKHQERTGRSSTLLVIEIDGLEGVRDRFGLPATDQALRNVAELLASRSRVADIAARLDNDRFIMWLEETGADGGKAKAQQIVSQCASVTVAPPPDAEYLTVCVGGAVSIPGTSLSFASLLLDAEDALRHARRNGRGEWAVITPENSNSDNDGHGEQMARRTQC